ncbi:MAG TPA: NADH-ubiquinone oxidoreductase-F iron-sulfur binding region domain-containing protein [Acidimicrobiales bacterium]|nr:NADH-ubiquinone oxidoreductase-F iron-sulfur binding region domain-containing protein [Acidimicrobiales bacterium]
MSLAMPRRVLDADPTTTLDDWIAGGGGRGLARAWELPADEIVRVLTDSGLRGRGGAGFPTGTKWATVRGDRSAELPATVVVNGAEGEPGSFKDRSILLANPYRVIEGALIAAAVVEADEVVLALKGSSPEVVDRVRRAIDEVREAGWLIEASVDVVVGPEHYLYGEETALLEVVNGREPFPRIAPPWRRGAEDLGDDAASAAQVDLAAPGATPTPPALVNNVETVANVPGIVANGAAWFREVGTADSPGTLVVTVSGGGGRAGVAEVPMGISLRDAIDLVHGAPSTGSVRAVLPGVSGAVIGADQLDVALTYEDLAAVGSSLGAGAFRVIGEADDPVAVAAGASRFLAVESCGQCQPCKQDGVAIAGILDRLSASDPEPRDEGDLGSRLETVADGARCYLATQHQQVVSSLIQAFPDAFGAHLAREAAPATPVLIAEIDRIDDGEAVLDPGQATKQPDWSHGAVSSGAAPADLVDQRAGEERPRGLGHGGTGQASASTARRR